MTSPTHTMSLVRLTSLCEKRTRYAAIAMALSYVLMAVQGVETDLRSAQPLIGPSRP